MRRLILLLLISVIILEGTYLLYNFKIDKTEKANFKTLSKKNLEANTARYYKNLNPKDLNPKSFISLFKERYNKTSINSISMLGDFPDNWVKPNDVQYLMSIMKSKEKCCGYMNVFSSHISTEDAEVGGFAIVFLNSYISRTKINLGLNSYPKTNKQSIKKIEDWYRNSLNKN